MENDDDKLLSSGEENQNPEDKKPEKEKKENKKALRIILGVLVLIALAGFIVVSLNRCGVIGPGGSEDSTWQTSSSENKETTLQDVIDALEVMQDANKSLTGPFDIRLAETDSSYQSVVQSSYAGENGDLVVKDGEGNLMYTATYSNGGYLITGSDGTVSSDYADFESLDDDFGSGIYERYTSFKSEEGDPSAWDMQLAFLNKLAEDESVITDHTYAVSESGLTCVIKGDLGDFNQYISSRENTTEFELTYVNHYMTHYKQATELYSAVVDVTIK